MGSEATFVQPPLTSSSSIGIEKEEKNISFYKCTHCPVDNLSQKKRMAMAPLAPGETDDDDLGPSAPPAPLALAKDEEGSHGTKICDSGSPSASSSVIGSPIHRQIYFRNVEKTTQSSSSYKKFLRRTSSSSHETVSSSSDKLWDSGWSSASFLGGGQSPQSGSPDSGHMISKSPTTRDIILDTALNVPHLVIGENEEFSLDPTDQLYLPAIKTFTWHSPLPSPAQAEQKAEPKGEEDEGISADDSEAEWRLRRRQLRRRRTAYMILKAAVNLEEIKDFHFDTDADLVIRAGKVPAVHHLCLYDTDSVDLLLSFIDGGPRLKVLQLISSLQELLDDEEDEGGLLGGVEGRQKLSQAISKLLDSVRDTLRVLDLSQFSTICVHLEIPPLEKLHQLTLGSPLLLGDPKGKPFPSRVWPRHLKMDVSFPYLSVLDVCRMRSEENCNWDLYFPSAHSFQNQNNNLKTVRVLVVNDQCTHFWMERLQDLCPNFVKLVIHSDGLGNDLEFMLVKVFRYWQHLEAIELRIEDLPIQPFSLDSAFTGLREDTCRLLRVFGPAGHDCMVGKEELEKSYFRPSIANLSHLHTLDIILDHHCLGRLAHQASLTIPLTFVSCIYGFSHLAQLKVAIFFDQNCPWGKAIIKKFESLLPYVTLLHKYDGYCRRAHHHQGNTIKFNR